MLPSMLQCNVDFSENFTYNLGMTRTQSAHLKSYQCMLFVCFIQYLDKAVFDDTASPLVKGDEVSFSSDDGNLTLHDGVVAEQNIREVDEYRRPLKDEECVQHICRSVVHKRVMKMIPLMTFSDDKHHDTYWVQKFFVGDSSVFEEWYRHLPEEIRSNWNHLLINSNGAASHFKQKYMLQAFCEWRLLKPRFLRFT